MRLRTLCVEQTKFEKKMLTKIFDKKKFGKKKFDKIFSTKWLFNKNFGQLSILHEFVNPRIGPEIP